MTVNLLVDTTPNKKDFHWVRNISCPNVNEARNYANFWKRIYPEKNYKYSIRIHDEFIEDM